MEGECQDDSPVICEKELQGDQNGGGGEEYQKVQGDHLETTRCDEILMVNEKRNQPIENVRTIQCDQGIE